ncbi:MAG TPA: AAA-like domain-containing protein [Gammaproteobacteria bacterium]|nr:AAA-like domain-containing protein [Gammaproteobacteria bacterium]
MVESGEPSTPANTPAAPAPRHVRRGESFFVAGGPVAPDRPCYIARTTDRQIYERLLAGDYCHVIAPRFSGKSSLAARTAHRLRTEGRLAAIVDLSQLGSRDGSTDVGRWYYGLAYRVLRDLRLKLDLQAWWQERMPLPPAQRLGEFFWEIVIGATRVPVTIFLDEIDSVDQLDYATELFSIVRACHDARAGEPEYRRLTFVLLGTALPSGPSGHGSLDAEVGARLELPDFRFENVRPFAEGLGMRPGDAERALYRVLYWTGGHPYLTQKLCQAVARNATRINSDEAVDRLVAARFFARNRITSETSMSRVLDGLDRAGKLARRALRHYRRISRGRRPRYVPGNPEQELLRVCGLVNITAERRLVVRNRIYAEVFTHRWAREALPVEWGRIGRVAALLGIVIGGVWAYIEVLPRPYEETLRVVSVEMDEALGAWSAMRRIPGFADRANRLLARVLTRRSRLLDSWPEVEVVDARLRALPGFEARADALLVEFWERRAADAEAAEQRDAALLYRLRAYVAGPTADSGRAAELAGGDYRQLRTVIRPAGVVEALAPTPDGRSVVTVSAGNIVERWSAGSGEPESGVRLELLAEEFITVRRRLSLDGGGRVAGPVVALSVDHPRPADLHIVLTSPAGRRAELPVARADTRDGMLLFNEARAPQLRSMRGEQTLGTWMLEIEDRESSETGFLRGWTLAASSSAAHRAEDRPENPLLLPAPARTSAVRVALSPRASVVAALPRNAEARGRLQAWEVASGRALASVDVGAGDRWIGFASESLLLLLETGAARPRLRILDVLSGEERLSHIAAGGIAAGPAVSPGGRYVAVAEAAPSVAWIRDIDAAREVFRLQTAGEATAVAVAPGGLLLAVADSGDVVRVWHTTDGALLAGFPQDSPVSALAFDPTGRWLAMADLDRQLRVWDLASPEAPPLLSRPGGDPRHFAFDPSGRRFVTLGPAGGYEIWGLPEAMPNGPILRHGGVRTTLPGTADRLAGRQMILAEDGLLVGGRGTRKATVWQVTQDAAPTELPPIALVVALAPSGLRMGAGLADGRVMLRMRDPDSLTLRQTLVTTGEARHGGTVTALAFSPDGRRLASVAADGSVLLWDAATGGHIGGLFQHGSGRVAAIDLAPDGRRLVTAGELGARTWDAETGEPGPALGPGRAVSSVALDAAGRRVFTGTPGGEVESWDVQSGERLWFGSVEAPVSRIAVSADGLGLAAASETGLVQAWGLDPGGRPVSTVLAAPVSALQFAPDGQTILAQTASWMHRLGVVDGRLTVLGSRMLPAAVPPGAWRIATADGTRLVLVGGAHSETMAVLDLERVPLPPDDWQPDLEGWQQKLKLYFRAGELEDGLSPRPLPVVAAPQAADGPGM